MKTLYLLMIGGLLSAPLLTARAQTVPAAPTTTPASAPPADRLIFRNGDEVGVRIDEITPDLIKYHRADNLQGPLFSVRKADVFMVRYANGTKEVFTAAVPAAAPPSTAPLAIPPPPSSYTQANLALAQRRAEDSVFAAISAGGPRLGVTVIAKGELQKRLRDKYDASNVITQFGWQFEQRLFKVPSGLSGVVEFVPLIGGLEQGLFLPSLSGILGIRGRSGTELGIGPNVSLAGAGLAIAAGQTIKGKYVNVPLNLAVVPSREGTRYSFLVGFTYLSHGRGY